MPRGSLWEEMNRQPRHRARTLSPADIPVQPGVYAWYRRAQPIYLGKADSLQNRLWKKHLGRGRAVTGSAFRRNVAEHLGISTAALIKARAYQPTDGELERLREFIESCAVAWRTTRTAAHAVDLERCMKAEWMPPLTKQ